MPSVRGNIYNPGHYYSDARETFSAENTSSGTTDATGQYRAQIKRTHAPKPPLILIGEVKCLAVDGGFFQARGVITDVQHGAPDVPGPAGFILWGYDSGKHSAEPDYYYVHYEQEPQLEGCVAPTTTEDMTLIQEGDIDVTDDT